MARGGSKVRLTCSLWCGSLFCFVFLFYPESNPSEDNLDISSSMPIGNCLFFPLLTYGRQYALVVTPFKLRMSTIDEKYDWASGLPRVTPKKETKGTKRRHCCKPTQWKPGPEEEKTRKRTKRLARCLGLTARVWCMFLCSHDGESHCGISLKKLVSSVIRHASDPLMSHLWHFLRGVARLWITDSPKGLPRENFLGPKESSGLSCSVQFFLSRISKTQPNHWTQRISSVQFSSISYIFKSDWGPDP